MALMTGIYFGALILFACIFAVVFLVIYGSFKILKHISKKTTSDIDDIIFARTEPICFLLGGAISLYVSLIHFNVISVLGAWSKLFFSIVVFLISWILYVLVDVVSFKALKKISTKSNSRLDETFTRLIHAFLRIILVIVAILFILKIWGVAIGPLLAGLGIAGLAVALALQPALANIFSGLSVVLDKSVRVGDLVYLDANTRGTVQNIGFRSTRIVTFDNELIIVPNSKLADSNIQNIALPDRRTRVTIPFSVAYGSNIEKVKQIVIKEISKIPHILLEEPVVVRFTEMADSSLKFKAYFLVNSYENRWPAIDEANTRIYNALIKNKIEIPFPQMDVRLRK